jgi:hypothetical protein
VELSLQERRDFVGPARDVLPTIIVAGLGCAVAELTVPIQFAESCFRHDEAAVVVEFCGVGKGDLLR